MGLFKQVTHIFRNPDRSLSPEASNPGGALLTEKVTSARDLSVDAKRAWLVRRREFSKLRVLRLQETDPDAVQKPPFFLTSVLLKSEERVSTLKKIDEIEAQMSMQWWKTDRLDLTKDV